MNVREYSDCSSRKDHNSNEQVWDLECLHGDEPAEQVRFQSPLIGDIILLKKKNVTKPQLWLNLALLNHSHIHFLLVTCTQANTEKMISFHPSVSKWDLENGCLVRLLLCAWINDFYSKEHKLFLIYCLFFSLNNARRFYFKNGQTLSRRNLSVWNALVH